MRSTLFLFLSFIICTSVSAQTNCSVNAGSPEAYCQGEKIKLRGAISGQFDISSIQWELVSSPAGSSILIDETNSINSTTNNIDIPGDYTFRLSLTCDTGSATQTVTHTVNPEAEGYLVFPDLFCFPEFQTFWVQKVAPTGNFFIYDFETDLKFKIVEQQADSIKLRIDGCFRDEFYYPTYRVSNQFGCSVAKTDTMQSIIEYLPEISFLVPDDDDCGNLIGYCPGVGTPLWTISSQPTGSSATLLTPNNKNTEVCGLIAGQEYMFQYSVVNSFCDQPLQSTGGPISPPDPCLSEAILLDNVTLKYCPGTIPDIAVLNYSSILEPQEIITWTQINGPPTNLIGTDKPDLTVSGLESGNLYTFEIAIYNPLNDCTTYKDYILFEEIIDPDIGFLVRNESYQFCSTFQSCNNQYFFQDKNLSQYFGVTMKVELISYPPNANINDPFFINFDTPGNEDVPLAFSNVNRVNNFFFDRLVLSQEIGGMLNFYLCSDVVPGNYSFNLTLQNDCFEYEESMILRTNSQLNDILPNAGTDQVLPCFQDSTTVVGNQMGTDDNDPVYGFWTTIQHPPNSPNPIPTLIQAQFLSLKDLTLGQYILRYYYFYNDINNNQNLCEYENRFDDVSVIVSENDIMGIPIISNQVFCTSDEYCIQLPIDDGGSATSISQTGGPNTSIPDIQFGGLICFEDLVDGEMYLFEYLIDNGCNLYSQEFELDIASNFLSPALIINQDTCVTGSAPDTHELMAESLSEGTGQWTYVGIGDASFSPSASEPIVTATITNGVNFPLYREFIWTVTSDDCDDVNQDKFIIKNNGYLPIEIEQLYIDCNATFPYSIDFNPSEAVDGAIVQWELLSSSSNDLPTIMNPQNDTTSIVFPVSGTFIFELKYTFGGDCGEEEEVAVVEVRLSESDAVAYAGEDIFACENIFQLSALNPEPMLGFWSVEDRSPIDLVIEFEDAEDYETNVTFLKQGNATLIWNILANEANCGVVSRDDVFLSWEEFNLESTDTALCNESLIVVEHSPVDNEAITWSLLNGPSQDYFIAPIDQSSTLFSNLVEGVYQFQYTYSNGNNDCSSSGTIQIAVLGVGQLNDAQSVCDIAANAIDNISLNINIPEFIISELTIQDKPTNAIDGIIPSINTDGISFSYTGFDVAGTYLFEIIGTSTDCEVTAFLSLTVGAPPVDELPSSLSFCEGLNSFLNPGGDPDLYYQWTPANLVDNPSSENPQFIGTESKTLSVLISGSPDFDDCVAMKDISVEISKIDASISAPLVLCGLQEVTLELFSSDLNLNIEWLDQNLSLLGNGTSITLNPESDMLIQVNVTDGNGCTLSLSTTIEISPLIDGVSAQADPTFIDLGMTTQLAVNNNLGPLNDCNIQWSPAESLSDASSQTPIASPISNQSYEVIVEKDGCIARDRIDIEVDNSCLLKEYFIPNMFTPNGDGHNDCFQVYGDMENFELYVYDRWGEEIILITETNACWDGSYKSQNLPPDVYAYYVKHIRCDGQELEFRGNITLIK